jgi:hypothetical protein
VGATLIKIRRRIGVATQQRLPGPLSAVPRRNTPNPHHSALSFSPQLGDAKLNSNWTWRITVATGILVFRMIKSDPVAKCNWFDTSHFFSKYSIAANPISNKRWKIKVRSRKQESREEEKKRGKGLLYLCLRLFFASLRRGIANFASYMYTTLFKTTSDVDIPRN